MLILFFIILLFLFLHFLVCYVFVATHGLSLVAVSGGYSLVAVHGLLIVVASLVVELGLQSGQASRVSVHGLSCSAACGISLEQVENPCPLH